MAGIGRLVRVGAAVALIAGGVTAGVPIVSRAGALVGGPSWSIVTTPNTTSPDNELHAVACVSSSDCWSVGSSDTEPGITQHTLAERWDGTAWSIVSTPNTSASHNYLSGVACIGASDCWAVGGSIDDSRQTLLEHWNGSAWSISAPSSAGALSGVACVTASDCWAVGASGGTLAEHWNGTAWSIVSTPNVPADANVLVGVTCTNTSNCWAVGQSVTGNVGKNLGEHWDGSTWSVVTPPDVAGQNDGLWEVACISASDCWTVGGSNNFVKQRTLAEHWDGSVWTIVRTANLPSANDGLLGLGCLSTSDCWAVGDSTLGQTLAEHWDGRQWIIAPSPAPNASEENQFSGVACTSTSDCWAVGAVVAANSSQRPSRTLAEHDTVAPIPVMTPSGAAVLEGNSGTTDLRVPVTLSNPSPHTVTAQWKTEFVPGAPAGQADPATDYAPASGTVTFAPGQTAQAVTISVNGDTLVEPDEYIVVSFTQPVNATIGGFWGLGFGVITNDDGNGAQGQPPERVVSR